MPIFDPWIMLLQFMMVSVLLLIKDPHGYNTFNMLFQRDLIPEDTLPLWIISDPVPEPLELEVEEQAESQEVVSMEQLYATKQKLVAFIISLKTEKKTELRGDVLAHCVQLNKNKRLVPAYISDENVVRMVNNRISKMAKNRKVKKNWSEEDVKILVWAVSKYADSQSFTALETDFTSKDWQNIAELIPGVTGGSCMFKWLNIRKVNLSVQHWLEAEATLLRDIIEEMATHPSIRSNNLNWKVVSERLYKVNPLEGKIFRSAKQCREHWNCYLNPKLKKGPWNVEEDIELLSLIHGNRGAKKWSEIVHSFEGRTENALKNRYTLLIDKQRRLSKSKQERSLVEDCLNKCKEMQATHSRESGRVFISDIMSHENIEENNTTGNHVDSKSKPKEAPSVQEQGVNTTEGPQLFESEESHSQHSHHSYHSFPSQTLVETPQSQSQMMIKLCNLEHFDALRQMALAREVRPGCMRNNVFQPEL